MTDETRTMSELLKDSPQNWGKWGPDDEVGSLNYLTPEVVVEASRCVTYGDVYTLQVPMANPVGDPAYPGTSRTTAQTFMVQDKSTYDVGKGFEFHGGLQYADDMMICYLQGSTQYDALGHVWYDDQIWNGYPASSTIGGLERASVMPLAERGIVGRGVLLDMARHRGVEKLTGGETFTHIDLQECAAAQNVELRKHDIIVVRTGWLTTYYTDKETFMADPRMPGLCYSPELVSWFQDMEIPSLATDTFGNEVLPDPNRSVELLLHGSLMRDLGVAFAEVLWLEELGAGCAAREKYDFLYTAAPLKVVAGAGAPVNPVAVL